MSYVIHPKYTVYYLNHFINVSSNFYTTCHVHPRILYMFRTEDAGFLRSSQ
jgi:hypothetical protein